MYLMFLPHSDTLIIFNFIRSHSHSYVTAFKMTRQNKLPNGVS